MMSLTPQGVEDPFARTLRTHTISLTALVAIVVQAIGFVVWLVQLGAEVKQLRLEVTQLHGHQDSMVERLRILDTIRDRQGDVIANNAAQDARIRELEQKLVQFDRNHVELNAISKRLDEQQLRIIGALDNTYNLLNEHLREHGSRVAPPPPILRPQQR